MASATQADAFKRDGFHIAHRLFEAEEMDLLLKISKADQELARKAGDVKDAKGGNSRLTLWNDLGENIYSAFVRCHRIVNTMEQFLDGEVYHYHHKMMQNPRVNHGVTGAVVRLVFTEQGSSPNARR